MQSRDDFIATVQDRSVVWRRIAYFICGDWMRAEDLLQQALLRMYLRWQHIEIGAVDAYARTVITRLAIDESRRSYHRSEISGEIPETGDTGTSVEDALVVRDALQRIPPGQRAAVVLRYYQDLSVAETARALGITQGSVKSQTARGFSALRAALVADHGADAGWPVLDSTIEVGER